MHHLARWGRSKVGDYACRIQVASDQVQQAIQNLKHAGSGSDLQAAENQSEAVLHEEELYWKQRSRELWLKDGDQNTRWFHCRASQRRKTNRIVGLFDSSGSWCDDVDSVVRIISDYFHEIYTTSAPLAYDFEVALCDVPIRVDD